MHFVLELWAPILLAAIGVFVVSSVLHMVIPVHRNDFKKLPVEDAFLAELSRNDVPPGEYVFPCPDSVQEMGTPEMIEKYTHGPVGFLTVRHPGSINMGVTLSQWFLYTLFVSVFTAYLAHAALPPGAEYLSVFRMAGTITFLGYGLTYIPNSIWKGTSWWTSAKFIFDGLIYGIVTGGIYGWLWPSGMLM